MNMTDGSLSFQIPQIVEVTTDHNLIREVLFESKVSRCAVDITSTYKYTILLRYSRQL